ncbi:MAG: flavocytochrome c [Turicibacter sp.]|nr:flavocytochrome c [Turicibacter sp.]
MKKWFKFPLIAIVLILSLSLVGCNDNGDEADAYENGDTISGVFTGTGSGHGGDIVVEVTIEDGEVVAIEVVEHNETEFFYELPFENVIHSVVVDGNLNIDAVAGATLTSDGVLEAITEALEAAGMDIEAMMLDGQDGGDEGILIELETDVIVVGGGGAGLASAVTAAQFGSDVIVLEKMPFLGGNTIISGSGYNAVNPRLQEAQDPPVEDSIEFHFQQTFEGGDELGDPELIQILVEEALAGIYWLQDLGMEWQDDIFMVPGALHRRSNMPVMPLGTGFIDAFQNFIEESSYVEVFLNTTVEELIVEDGHVVGVRATDADHNTVIVRATNGVILATGGFGANIEMRMYYDELWHVLDDGIPTTNFPGATGDGIVMGEDIGANLVGMPYIQLLPFGDPETGSLSGLIGSSMEDHIYVNLEGRRFIDEGARRDEMSAATLAQTDSRMYVVIDSRTVPTGAEYNFFGETHDALVAAGRIHRADTLEELAEMIGVDPEVFVQTIEDFNAAVDAGIDEFGRTVFHGRIEQAPFYAGARMPTVHHTMGGLQIDAYTRVIGVDGEVIPGLYAAGEVAGGIHGTNRLGGNALTEIIVFGRIAGESAALQR